MKSPFHLTLVSLTMITAMLGSLTCGEDRRRPKKLIATGWDHADPQRLAANLSEMEGRPFDGVVLRVTGCNPDGKHLQLNWAFLDDAWERAWFQEDVNTLKTVQSEKLTDNFVLLNANPGTVDWFDDAGWANIVDHCRIAAWVAKQGGAKGILFDPEPYASPHAMFHYAAQPERDQHTFAKYHAQSRLRGRQVMRAITDEYPEITLFCYFMNSVLVSAAGNADQQPALASSRYGLYPAFIDGWLDVTPPGVIFVDGCESAYRYNSTAEYLESAVAIKGVCQELVSPENRLKYRAQVQVGFGVYLDAYWNPKDSQWGTWYIDGLGGPRIERMRTNTSAALRVADKYVWIYGEKHRWWPTPNPRVRAETWPEALPGCDRVLAYVRDPVTYARCELAAGRRDGTLENLVTNGDFSVEQTAMPAGWSSWQEASSTGSFLSDRDSGASKNGSARASGVSNGCFVQSLAIRPGERYAVRASARTQGSGDTWIRIRWQTTDRKWTAQGKDRILLPEEPHALWREIFGVVEVPDDTARLVILLGVGRQQSADDSAWFDDIELYRLP